MEKLSFSMKHFSGHFYGQSFIKTVRGPCYLRENKKNDNRDWDQSNCDIILMFQGITQTSTPQRAMLPMLGLCLEAKRMLYYLTGRYKGIFLPILQT